MSTIELIAKTCHEANRVYCQALGDHSQVAWDDAPAWQRKSAIDGVEFRLKHPESTPQDLHNNWMSAKKREGWKYGTVKDHDQKTHPCMVNYQNLPTEQQVKDHLFGAIVATLAPLYSASADATKAGA